MLLDWDIFEEYVAENVDDCYVVFTKIAICEAKKYLSSHSSLDVDEAEFISDIVPRTTKSEVLVFVDPSCLSSDEIAQAIVTSQNIITSYELGAKKQIDELHRFFGERHKELLDRLSLSLY